jgi:Subtilase family
MAKKTQGATSRKSVRKSAPRRRARSPKTTAFGELSKESLPPVIYAQVSPRSISGVSMFDGQERINSQTVTNFFSDADVVQASVARLHEAGFTILQISPLTINISGSPATYRKAFNTDIVVVDKPVIKEFGKKAVRQFLDSPDTPMPGLIESRGTRFEDVIEGVALEEPVYFMAASAFAPMKSYWHLRVPGDVSLACNADKAHRTAITGRGIKVAMVDSGWFKHPYFVGRGYRASPVVLGPAAANPLADESGHGTGESANIFATAPDIDFLPVKINFVNSIGAFNAAVGLQPHIITCSWGSSVQNPPLSAANQALAAAIAAAVASGITVIFSAGNGHFGFPGQHPDVISAGGVFMNPDESLRASDYASGFISNIYPNRRVPDVCGLVGMRPRAIYIMLPLQPGDDIDVGNAGGTHPNGDETTNNDGWAAFSGTSAAAPQLAGVAALLKQACPGLTPADIKDILRKTARDVTAGTCSPSTGGHAATTGPDTATGDGLVDAHKAVMMAKVRCLGPITPITGPITPVQPITGPIQPVQPITGPIQPVQPITGPITPVQPITGPIQPVQPITGPIQPVQPINPGPVVPITPVRPIAPVVNPSPVLAGESATGGRSAQGERASAMTADDVSALEGLIVKGDFDV